MRFGRRREEATLDSGTVDLVAESLDGAIELVIVQSAPWNGSDAQLASLQEEVQTYVSFVLDGQMEKAYPQVAAKPWRIVISSLAGAPDTRTRAVLETLASRLPAYGGHSAASRRVTHDHRAPTP
jgi:hypothetical protein